MSASATKPQSILLVEDREDDVILLKIALQKAGIDYPVNSVPGGFEAIAYLSGDPPYNDRERYPFPVLVFLDIRMPRVDGFEVLRWIRARSEFAKLPVVMLTGVNEIKEVNIAYQLGATSFMVKSQDFRNVAELSRTVNHLILKQ